MAEPALLADRQRTSRSRWSASADRTIWSRRPAVVSHSGLSLAGGAPREIDSGSPAVCGRRRHSRKVGIARYGPCSGRWRSYSEDEGWRVRNISASIDANGRVRRLAGQCGCLPGRDRLPIKSSRCGNLFPQMRCFSSFGMQLFSNCQVQVPYRIAISAPRALAYGSTRGLSQVRRYVRGEFKCDLGPSACSALTIEIGRSGASLGAGRTLCNSLPRSAVRHGVPPRAGACGTPSIV